jgi:alkanesulfonate monooxygenase SsuD/methylene tetrahydromethanopterin reductase-like flavin-dependent oxidoreductase (luciferase family)
LKATRRKEPMMHYGITLPNMGLDAHDVVSLAHDAEEAGWEAVLLWDCIDMGRAHAPTHDPWILLAAIAATTKNIRIGPIITPLSRRRPWKVARETVTLDHLSNGRAILPVGLGEVNDSGFSKVGEPTDRRVRAQLLDESLDIITGLWSGKPFGYKGEYYTLQAMTFLPVPVQTPRIPIWVVGAWKRPKSLQRALRYDGILPAKMNADDSFADMTPADIADMKRYITAQRSADILFDIVVEGETLGDNPEQAAAIVHPFAEAGVTWWLESIWRTPETQGGIEGMRKRIQQGPPPA